MSSALSPDPESLSTPDLIKALRSLANDGYSNIVTGMGHLERDSARATRIAKHVPLSLEEIDDLYRSDFIARTVVDTPAADATRQGVGVVVQSWASGDAEDDTVEASTAISDAIEDMGLDGSLKECARLERLHGGSAGLIAASEEGARGLDAFKLPLDPRKVSRIARVLPLERRSLRPAGALIVDPASRNFGMPSTWTVRIQDAAMNGINMGALHEVEVHHSRLLLWRGLPVSKYQAGLSSGMHDSWGGDSVLETLNEPLRQYRVKQAYTEAAFKRFSLIVSKMSGLSQLIMENPGTGPEAVMRRLRLMHMAISTMSTVPVDKETEELSELASTLAGVADILRIAQDNVAGAARMPLTKLFGHSPAGFSADDEAGRENYKTQVSDLQTDKLRPAYNEIVRILCLMPSGPTQGRLPRRWQVVFRPQETLTDTERVDNLVKLSTVLRDLADAEIISRVEGRNTLRSDPMTMLVLDEGDGVAGLEEVEPEPEPTDVPAAPPAAPAQPADTSAGVTTV